MKHSVLFWVILGLAVIVLLLALVVMPVLTVKIYDANFSERYEAGNTAANKPAFYPRLEAEACTFKTLQGHTLAGMKYHKKDQEIKGVAVIAHGMGGGGQKSFTNIADRFTSDGYLVFAYDATGNDLSGGEGTNGLPQGIIDLDHALRFVKEQPEYKDLPIVLFGYSWGAYSVGSVLNLHPDVKAAVMASGFDRSSGMILQRGADYVGKTAVTLMLPYVQLYERYRFGAYASLSATGGFETAKDTRVMIIYSLDDDTVRPENGYEPFLPYQDDPRFTFKIYEGRYHRSFWTRPDPEKLDDELFGEIASFYDSCCKGE